MTITPKIAPLRRPLLAFILEVPPASTTIKCQPQTWYILGWSPQVVFCYSKNLSSVNCLHDSRPLCHKYWQVFFSTLPKTGWPFCLGLYKAIFARGWQHVARPASNKFVGTHTHIHPYPHLHYAHPHIHTHRVHIQPRRTKKLYLLQWQTKHCLIRVWK